MIKSFAYESRLCAVAHMSDRLEKRWEVWQSEIGVFRGTADPPGFTARVGASLVSDRSDRSGHSGALRALALFLACLLAPTLVPASSQPTGDPAIISPDAKLELLFAGAFFTESPAVASDGRVYFSDITFTRSSGMQAGHIWVYDPETEQTTIFRSPSGMSNGIKFDARGRLVVAEGADYGGRRVTRTNMETGKSEIIAGLYQGAPFNAPNDIAIDEKGRIYFSDPRYLGHEPIRQPVMGVYRIDPVGSIQRVINDAGKPNGLAISPDQKTLYVVSHDNGTFYGAALAPEMKPRKGHMALLAYDLDPEGMPKFREDLVNYAPGDGPDGLVVDVEGNLYVAVRDERQPGIYIYSPRGTERAYIPTESLPTNVGFGRGEASRTLYVTAGGSLYRIKVMKRGYHLPPE